MNFNLYLKDPKSKNDSPIILSCAFNNQRVKLSTGLKIKPSLWNLSKQKVKGTFAMEYNEVLDKLKKKAEKTFLQLKESDCLNVDAFKELWNKESEQKSNDFFCLFDEYLNIISATKTLSTIKQYQTTRMHLKNFEESRRKKIILEKVDYDFYQDFQKYMLVKAGLANNTVGVNIKNLKAFLTKLKERDYPVKVNLKLFKVMKEDPTIIYLNTDELDQLYKFDFSSDKRLERVRDIFILNANLGLRFSDLKRLGQHHIQGNNIRLKSHKCKTDVFIPITKIANEILGKYDFQIPLISEQRYNLYIKEACQKAGIVDVVEVAEYKGGVKSYKKYFKWELISSHVAIKSFITACGEKGISAKTVSLITGKSVRIILSNYYGSNEKFIQSEMERAFGKPEPILKVV